jgi:hypothetical protein
VGVLWNQGADVLATPFHRTISGTEPPGRLEASNPFRVNGHRRFWRGHAPHLLWDWPFTLRRTVFDTGQFGRTGHGTFPIHGHIADADTDPSEYPQVTK